MNAVIELNPDALQDADRLDAERAAGKLRGPLHGIPVLVKDNIDVVGMVNSAGSLALADNRPQQDAFLVARLRAAGAVLLGKTNLSEWANFRSTHSTSGWSSRGGQTRNPYVLDRNPCGSSSGTGAAIAASLATVGVGTETDGSIICPAAVNGLVGLKPTVGLVSRRGIIPISASQDTAGPMGRTVADVAALLAVLVAADDADPASAQAKSHAAPDYTAFLNPGALAGKRIGLVRQALGFNADVDAAMERAVATMTTAGAIVIDVKVDGYRDWEDPEMVVLLYEFKNGINAYLKAAGVKPGSLAELIEWNGNHRDTVMPWFGQELFERAQAKGSVEGRGLPRGARQGAQERRRRRLVRNPRCEPRRRADGAERGSRVGNGPVVGRSLWRRWRRRDGGHRRYAEYHGADGRVPRLAARSGADGRGVQRSTVDRSRVRVRTGVARAHPAEILRDTPRHDARCEGRRCALTICASVAFGR